MRIRRAVWRWLFVDAQTIEHFRATLPMFRDWLALLDGEPVGVGACGLLPTGEASRAAFALDNVVPAARGHGVGTAIYRQVSEHARSLGKSELETWGFEDDAGGVAFAEHRRFVVVGRSRSLRLVLDDCPRPSIDVPEGVDGVLYKLGANSGGLTLFADQGRLVYEYNLFIIQRTQIRTDAPIPTGKARIKVTTTYEGDRKPAGPLHVAIAVDDTVVAEGTVPMSAPLAFTANDCLDIGRALGSPVSLDYFDKAPFPFTGAIDQVTVRYL